MSIQTELTRIKNAKAAIKAAIEGKGVTVPDATLLDGMASLIESIEAGGGGGANIQVMTFTPATTGVSEWFSFDKIPFYIVCMRKDFTYTDSFYKDVNEVPLCIAIDYEHADRGTQHGIVFYNGSSSYFSGETSFYNSSLNGNNRPSSNMPVSFRWVNSHPCYFAFYTANVGSKGLRVGETYQIIVVFRE